MASRKFSPLTPLHRALAISLLLHLAVLSLQFGLPGKGQPSSGWVWGARSAHLPTPPTPPAPPTLHLELRTAPQEAVAQPSAPLPMTTPLANTTVAPRRPSPPTPSAFTVQLRKPLPPAPPHVAPPPAPPQARRGQSARRGMALLSVRKKNYPDTWRITTPETSKDLSGRSPLAHSTAPQTALPDPLTPANPTTPPPPAAVINPQPEPERKVETPPASEEAERLQRQLAERAAQEKVAAQTLQRQRDEEQARARAQAEEAQRRAERQAERAALARQSAEEEALSAAELRQAQARAEAQQQQRKQEQARREAEQQAAERAQAEAQKQRLAEQAARQAEEAQARAQAEAAAQEARQQQAAAQAAQAAQSAQSAQVTKALATAGSTSANATSTPAPRTAPASGRSLADQALAMARSGLPLRPPVDIDTLAQGSRRHILGRNPADVQLSFYSDSWTQKVERLSRVNYPRLSRNRAYGSLVVSVTIRHDGSLVAVHVLKSSGSAEIDEAARRLIALCAPFAAFPPDLRRLHDTLEITRTLSFPEQPPLIISQ